MVMMVGVVVVVVTLVVMVRIFVLCFAGMVCKDKQFLAILLGSATCIASLISEVSSKGDMVSSIFVVKTGRPAAGNVLHVLCGLCVFTPCPPRLRGVLDPPGHHPTPRRICEV